MRRLAATTVMGLMGVLLSGSVALAAPPHDGCAVGPNGPGNTTIGPWQLLTQDDYAEAIEPFAGDAETAAEIAAAVFGKEDRNLDGILCVMRQVLPNDASGFDTWLVSHDNTANAR